MQGIASSRTQEAIKSPQVQPGRVAALKQRIYKHLDPKTQAPQPNVYDEVIEDYDDTLSEEPVMSRSGPSQGVGTYQNVQRADTGSSQHSYIAMTDPGLSQHPGVSRANPGSSKHPGVLRANPGLVQHPNLPRSSHIGLSQHANTSRLDTRMTQHPNIFPATTGMSEGPTTPRRSNTPASQGPFLSDSDTSALPLTSASMLDTPTTSQRPTDISMGPLHTTPGTGGADPNPPPAGGAKDPVEEEEQFGVVLVCRCCTCFTPARWWRLRWLTLGVLLGLAIGAAAGITCTYFFAGKSPDASTRRTGTTQQTTFSFIPSTRQETTRPTIRITIRPTRSRFS